MCDTTTSSLGSASIALSCSTSTFLRGRFFAASGDISKVFSFLEDVTVLVFEVMEHIMDYVSSQRQVVNLWVKLSDLLSKRS